MKTERFRNTKGTLAVLQCLRELIKRFQVFNNEDILQRMEIRFTDISAENISAEFCYGLLMEL